MPSPPPMHLYVWYPAPGLHGYVVLAAPSLKEALKLFHVTQGVGPVDSYIATNSPDEVAPTPGGLVIHATPLPQVPRETDFL